MFIWMLATVLVHPCARFWHTQFILHTFQLSYGWTWLAMIFGNISGEMMLWSFVSIFFNSFFFEQQHQSSISFIGWQAIHQIFRICLGIVNFFSHFCLFIWHHRDDSKLFKTRLWHWTLFPQWFVVFVPLDAQYIISSSKNIPFSETPLSKFLFYYLPICVIYTMNVVFSILTAMEIRRAHRHVDSLFSPLRNQTNLDTTSYNFTLYLRLFIVTGISWSVDAFAFIHHDSIFFYLTDICNSLQGVFIFILFIMKPRVLRLIKNRFVTLFISLELHDDSIAQKIIHYFFFCFYAISDGVN